jgi:poly(hydroxyalkanoate) depolymerase family esterase
MKDEDHKSELTEVELVEPTESPEVQPQSMRFSEVEIQIKEAAATRQHNLFVPSDYEQGQETELPLVVMLHGCTQDARTFAAATKMNDVAEDESFIVAYPEQSRHRNHMRCWTWFQDSNTTRDAGEAAFIAGVTREVIEQHAVDTDAIYLAGLSAGGGMAANMAVAYPDLYTAVGIHSGLPYDAAENADEAGRAMRNESGYSPQAKGTQAYEDMDEYANTVPTIVFHGNDDRIVHPANANYAAEQATQMNDLASDDRDDDNIDYVADRVVNGRVGGLSRGLKFTRSEYHDENQGEDAPPVVVKYIVDQMGHAWSGGSSASGGTFVDPRGPAASRIMWEFFEAHQTHEIQPTATARSVAGMGEAVTFTGRGSEDPDGSIVSYEWEFGDESTATGETVSHEFTEPGEYTVVLTVVDDTGATGNDVVNIWIEEQ